MKRMFMGLALCSALALPSAFAVANEALDAAAQKVQGDVAADPTNAESIAQASLLLACPSDQPGLNFDCQDAETAEAIATAAIQGLVDSGMSGPDLAQEAGEIASALFALLPNDLQDGVAAAIANATPDPSDNAQVIAEAADGVQTAGPGGPFGNRRGRPLSRVPSFVQLPAAASPN